MSVNPRFLVGISIRTITATIHVAGDGAMNFDIGSVIYFARNIVTAIHIVDFTAGDINASRIAGSKIEAIDVFGNRLGTRIHIGHTATAIHIVYANIITLDGNADAAGRGHGTAVTTRIEVIDVGFLQVPSGADVHFGQVVATKHTVDVIGENHLAVFETIVGAFQ